MDQFLVAKQLYTWPCLFVCLSSVFYMKYLSLFKYQEYSRIFKTSKHTDVRNESKVLHLRRSVINWHRWLEFRTLVDNSITCLGWNYNHIQLKQDMELNLNPTQTGNGSMKRYASCKINCQLIADLRRRRTWNSKLIRSFMSFLFKGQLSTDKLTLQLVYFFHSSISCLGWN